MLGVGETILRPEEPHNLETRESVLGKVRISLKGLHPPESAGVSSWLCLAVNKGNLTPGASSVGETQQCQRPLRTEWYSLKLQTKVPLTERLLKNRMRWPEYPGSVPTRTELLAQPSAHKGRNLEVLAPSDIHLELELLSWNCPNQSLPSSCPFSPLSCICWLNF